MNNTRCRACRHYILQWSYIYESYVEGCDAGEECKFENKKKGKKIIAVIKRR